MDNPLWLTNMSVTCWKLVISTFFGNWYACPRGTLFGRDGMSAFAFNFTEMKLVIGPLGDFCYVIESDGIMSLNMGDLNAPSNDL